MGGIGNQAIAGAVHVQIELFQHRLPDEDFVAEDQRLFHRIASFPLDQ